MKPFSDMVREEMGRLVDPKMIAHRGRLQGLFEAAAITKVAAEQARESKNDMAICLAPVLDYLADAIIEQVAVKQADCTDWA